MIFASFHWLPGPSKDDLLVAATYRYRSLQKRLYDKHSITDTSYNAALSIGC